MGNDFPPFHLKNQVKSGKVVGGGVTNLLKMTKFNLKIVQPDHFTAVFKMMM